MKIGVTASFIGNMPFWIKTVIATVCYDISMITEATVSFIANM